MQFIAECKYSGIKDQAVIAQPLAMQKNACETSSIKFSGTEWYIVHSIVVNTDYVKEPDVLDFRTIFDRPRETVKHLTLFTCELLWNGNIQIRILHISIKFHSAVFDESEDLAEKNILGWTNEQTKR